MLSLAVYHPLHFWSMATAVSLPARRTASQKSTYLMSREVNSIRYLLYSFCCSSSLHIFLHSISPRLIDDFSLYLMEVRLRAMLTAQWLLSSPSRVVQQLRIRLCSVADQTIASSMWVSAIPELVGWLLVQVLYPGLFDLASKRCSWHAAGVQGKLPGDSHPFCCVWGGHKVQGQREIWWSAGCRVCRCLSWCRCPWLFPISWGPGQEECWGCWGSRGTVRHHLSSCMDGRQRQGRGQVAIGIT